MEIPFLKVLLDSISSYLHFSNSDYINSVPVTRCYYKGEEILKLLKPILNVIDGSELVADETLCKTFEELGLSVGDLRELIEYWQPLSSKVYFILQIESSLCKIQTYGIKVLQQLKESHQCLPEELSTASLEVLYKVCGIISSPLPHLMYLALRYYASIVQPKVLLQQCMQKIKHVGHEQTSSTIKDAITDQNEGNKPSSKLLEKISENLGLETNLDILIEAVALEKLKENAEQAEKSAEAEYMDQIITLVTYMHEYLLAIKQSERCSPVPIPADFCCPLSLELMIDPVIVASGQTYERVYIKNWIELGLTVCPKTRQTLSHTNLIPNYTVKALIANWCELNNVKLVEPMKPVGLSQASRSIGLMDSGATREVVFASSRINQMLVTTHSSVGSPAKNSISSDGAEWEDTSPLHPQSSSDGFLPAENIEGLDIARLSLTDSDDRPANAEESVLDIDTHLSLLPSGKDSSNFTAEEKSRHHMRTASESSTLVNANSSQGPQLDANDTSQARSNLTGYSSDASAEVSPGPDSASTLTAPQREPEFPLRLMDTRSRNQAIWRRPSERFMPRMVSSTASETRPDLSGIENQVRKLVVELKSSSLDTQREATSQLRLLAKHNMDNRIVIANSGAISLLVNLLWSTDAGIQENAVTALLNLSINDNNKSLIANADAIDPLIHVLETGSPEAKENSAATLFSLSVIEENKIKIGRSGAVRPLVDLLGNGTPRGKKDAATALFNLSIFNENKGRIVQAGAVKHLVDLMDPAVGMVDKAVAVLANLATIPEGRTSIGQENGIPVLVEVVELGSSRGKENAAAALLHLCQNSGRFCSQVLQEGAVPPLVALSQSGTPRAKEKAQALLSYFRNQRHGNAGRV